MNCEKPPIGAKPYYIQAEDRIRELAGAIIRNPNCDRVKERAVEIALQKELIDRMKEK